MVADRPTGILTKTQRKFLTGEKEYSGEYAKQQRYQRRISIEDRLRNAIRDFRTLNATLSDNSIDKALRDEYDDDIPPDEKMHVANSLESVFALFYRGLKHSDIYYESPMRSYEEFIEGGLKNALNKEGKSVKNISVSIDIEEGPKLGQYREKDKITHAEAKQMLQGGELSIEEYIQLSNSSPEDVNFDDESDMIFIPSPDDEPFFPGDQEENEDTKDD